MTSSSENILQHLFHTTSLQGVSAEQILQEINDYPYNGAAYFLLAKKLYLLKEPGYEKALQKAALHFSNDLWLNFNLHEDSTGTIEEDFTKTEVSQNAEVDLTKDRINEFPETESVKEFGEVTIIGKEDQHNLDEDETDLSKEPAGAYVADEKLSNILKEQAAAFEKPVEASAELPVENIPYHRVDYFGSQGIKLDEDKPDDKLGSQLKRFTDWLKQMKRVNANPAEFANDEAGETKVKNIAEHSNEPEEVVTEAMAEVLVKQGKPEQAIQIYQKLSFNNPAKSAYFAAKIEELKG